MNLEGTNMTKSEITAIVLAQFGDSDGFTHSTRDRVIRTCIAVRNTTQQKIKAGIEEIQAKNDEWLDLRFNLIADHPKQPNIIMIRF